MDPNGLIDEEKAARAAAKKERRNAANKLKSKKNRAKKRREARLLAKAGRATTSEVEKELSRVIPHFEAEDEPFDELEVPPLHNTQLLQDMPHLHQTQNTPNSPEYLHMPEDAPDLGSSLLFPKALSGTLNLGLPAHEESIHAYHGQKDSVYEQTGLDQGPVHSGSVESAANLLSTDLSLLPLQVPSNQRYSVRRMNEEWTQAEQDQQSQTTPGTSDHGVSAGMQSPHFSSADGMVLFDVRIRFQFKDSRFQANVDII
ncbi:hypothetical protein BKA66DRAFT_254505 [Pyrenochaeta sp. MPI-SDFR-AT-0127]|nr:hypothetical protein BKA66DRAFT_254505 [Pyrenochaeta sp. MPI-SDFR-AT-0127]